MKNASIFIAKNVALLHHPLCNLSILLSVNLTNFTNLFHFSSFGAGLSKVIYSTACNFGADFEKQKQCMWLTFIFQPKLFDFSTYISQYVCTLTLLLTWLH